MTRWLVLAFALMLGAVAPARAWCEAICVAPAAESTSHCPSHGPADGTTAIAASAGDDCPVLESARPTVPARLDVHATIVRTCIAPPILRTHIAPSFDRSHNPATVFERCTPLRI